MLTLFKLHCLAKPITLGIVWCQLGGPPHAKLSLKALTWQFIHVGATVGCFTNQISSEWLDIVIVSMRWAFNFFLNLKVIKGSSSYAIREIFTSSRRPTLLGKLSCRPTLLGKLSCLSSRSYSRYLFIFFSTPFEVLYQETEALSTNKPSQLP